MAGEIITKSLPVQVFFGNLGTILLYITIVLSTIFNFFYGVKKKVGLLMSSRQMAAKENYREMAA